jgi:apolipoprotein N-acyltransferase
VEHGREVLISATSGVSAVIRPDGSVESSVPLFTAGYMTPQVPLITATTPGTVLGAPLQWLLVALTPVALLVAWLVRRRRPDPAPAAQTGTTTAPHGSPEQESTT